MKLLELVDYLLDPAKLPGLYRDLGLFAEPVAAHGVAIYLAGSTLALDADIRLLSYRETQGNIAIELDGLAYIYLLEVALACEVVATAEPGVVTTLDKATRLIDYALYDA